MGEEKKQAPTSIVGPKEKHSNNNTGPSSELTASWLYAYFVLSVDHRPSSTRRVVIHTKYKTLDKGRKEK